MQMSRKSKSNKKDELKPPTPDIVKKRLIKGGIRRVFRQSIEMRVVLQSSRIELPPKTLKDGSVGKKNQVRYKCAVCGNLFSQKDVAVDHIEPVIPLHRSEEDLTIDEMAYRIWCDTNNLQVVCNTTLKKNNGIPSCHKIKTDEENFIRKRLKEVYPGMAEDPSIWPYEALIKESKQEYKIYLEEKEKERLEKEKRKAEREAKRKAKK
jgi:hypothetical protein